MPYEPFPPSYPPVNVELVDKIVSKLKSQGIFDQFRKDCLADVDTKPAYQNLQQRVNGTVASFLATRTWQPDLNKIQLRESLRRHVQQGFLEVGVDRIVDQVVNPKIFPVFMPKVEDVVYDCLGIEKPKNQLPTTMSAPFIPAAPPPPPLPKPKSDTPTIKASLLDLLPKDLDPVSPESDNLSISDGTPTKDERNNNETPDQQDSQLSGISDLSSHMGDSFRENAPDSNTVKSISSPKGTSSEHQFANFTNLSEKIKQAEKSHGQVTDPHTDMNVESYDLDAADNNESSRKEIKHDDSLNDEVKLELMSNNSLTTFEDSKTFITNKFVKDDTCTSFSEDSFASSSFSNKDKMVVSTTKPSMDSENSINQIEHYEKSSTVTEGQNEKESKDDSQTDRPALKSELKSVDENKDLKKHDEKEKKDRDSSTSSKTSRSSDKHRTSESKHRPSHDRKEDKDRKDHYKSSKEKGSHKDEKERSSKDDRERSKHKDDKHHSSKDKQKEKEKSNDKNKDRDSNKKDRKTDVKENTEKKTDRDHNDREKSSKDKHDKEKEKSSRSKHDRDKDRHEKDKREKDRSEKEKKDKDKEKEKSDKDRSKQDKEKHDKIKNEKEKEARHDRDKDKTRNDSKRDDKKKDSRKYDKSSHSSSSKKGDNKYDERDKKNKNDESSSQHKSNNDKSKKDDDKKDRKRKGERCNDEIKSKEARRSSDRDSSGGKGGSSHRSRTSENKAGSSHDSGPAEKRMKSSNSDGNTESHEQQIQPSDGMEGPSEIEMIITKLNSSIEESKTADDEKEYSVESVPVKKPKIARNMFEIKKIMQARKNIDRKVRQDLTKNRKEDTEERSNETVEPSPPQSTGDKRIPEENKENIKSDQTENFQTSKNLNTNGSFFGFHDFEAELSAYNFLNYCDKTNIVETSIKIDEYNYNALEIYSSVVNDICRKNSDEDHEELLDNNLNNLKPKIKSLEKNDLLLSFQIKPKVVDDREGCCTLLNGSSTEDTEKLADIVPLEDQPDGESSAEKKPKNTSKQSAKTSPKLSRKKINEDKAAQLSVNDQVQESEVVLKTENPYNKVEDVEQPSKEPEASSSTLPEPLHLEQSSLDSPIRKTIASCLNENSLISEIGVSPEILTEAMLDTFMKQSLQLQSDDNIDLDSEDSDYELKTKEIVCETREVRDLEQCLGTSFQLLQEPAAGGVGSYAGAVDNSKGLETSESLHRTPEDELHCPKISDQVPSTPTSGPRCVESSDDLPETRAGSSRSYKKSEQMHKTPAGGTKSTDKSSNGIRRTVTSSRLKDQSEDTPVHLLRDRNQHKIEKGNKSPTSILRTPTSRSKGSPKEGSAEKIAGRNQRLSRSSQRYESTDLYKPRPVLPQNSKRVRSSRSVSFEDTPNTKRGQSEASTKRRNR